MVECTAVPSQCAKAVRPGSGMQTVFSVDREWHYRWDVTDHHGAGFPVTPMSQKRPISPCDTKNSCATVGKLNPISVS